MKENKPGWQKAEPVERVYVKYNQKNNLPTHEANIPNKIEKEVKALVSAVFVTSIHWKVLSMSLTGITKNLTPSQKELLRWNFRLGHIGFQHVQWLIRTGRMKVQGNSKVLTKCERPKSDFCEFGKGHRQPNKVNTIKNNNMKEQELKKDNIMHGQMVSADHNI